MIDAPQTPLTAAATPRVGLARWVRARMYVAGGVVTLLFAAIAYKAYGLQVRDTQRYRDLAARQHLKTVEVPAPRGVIYDRTGKELAVSAEIDSVFANPREVEDRTATAGALALALGLDVKELEQRLSSPGYFVWIARHVAPAEARAVAELELPGVQLTKEPRRFYPSGNLAGPVLGFAGIDGNGLDGVELAMDELLSGQRAKIAALRDASGTLMLTENGLTPEPGAQVTLTLDRFIQFATERALADVVTASQAKAGIAVVMEVETGEVLAMASVPTFDPNAPGEAVRGGARNRAISDVYEVGSVMKVFTIAAALEAGVVRPNTWFDVEKFQIGRKVYRDSYHDKRLTVGGILKRSSNVGTIKIARMLGKDRLRAALVEYGFGAATDIELPGERPGYLRPAARWGETALAAAAFGYDLTVTPLQVTAALSAIGNRGVYLEPRLIAEVRSASGKVLYRRQPIARQIISEKTALALQQMMGSVFDRGKDGGTGRALVVQGFKAGGKSGTAKKVDPATRSYSKHLYISSFAGLAPIADPKIAVFVMVDEPHGEKYYGADVAGPAFARICSETLRYLGVPTEVPIESESEGEGEGEGGSEGESGTESESGTETETETETRTETETETETETRTETETETETESETGTESGSVIAIPDFSGMGIAQALERAAGLGLRVDIDGSGRVVDQTPAPGRHHKPAELRLVFSSSP